MNSQAARLAEALGRERSAVLDWLSSPGVHRARNRARSLRIARQTSVPCSGWDAQWDPLALEDAYEIQRLNVCGRILEGAIPAGYKIGLTSRAVREQFGLESPDRGIIMDDDFVPSGSELPFTLATKAKIEVEYAIVVDKVELMDAHWIMVPRGGFLCFEILSTRFCSWKGSVAKSVADNAALSHVVVGSPLLTVDPGAVSAESVVVLRNNCEVTRGAGYTLDGGPWGSVNWLLKSLHPVDPMLKPGDVILTGALAPVIDVSPGDNIEAVTSGGSEVRVRFSSGVGHQGAEI